MASDCNKKPTEPSPENGREVWVSVDWSDFNRNDISGMSLYFYPKDKSDSTPIVDQYNSISGAMVYLPYGLYDILLFNQSVDEFGHIHFTGMDRFDTATAELEEFVPDWNVKTDGQKLAYEPELLAVAIYENFNSETTESIRLKPHSIIYSVKASLDVKGLDRVQAIRGSITGMAGACNLSSGLQTDTAVTHILTDWIKVYSKEDKSNGTVFTTFRSFGSPAGKNALSAEDVRIHSSYLFGNKYYVNFSIPVGDTMTKNDSTRTISFTAEESEGTFPIEIPLVSTKDDSGFEVSIEPWGKQEDTYVIFL